MVLQEAERELVRIFLCYSTPISLLQKIQFEDLELMNFLICARTDEALHPFRSSLI